MTRQRIKRNALCLSAVLLLLAPSSANAATADDAAASRRVAELIEQLNADEAAERDEAEKQLIELGLKGGAEAGDAFIDKLPKPNDRMPQEVQARLARVASEVRSRMAKKSLEATQ